MSASGTHTLRAEARVGIHPGTEARDYVFYLHVHTAHVEVPGRTFMAPGAFFEPGRETELGGNFIRSNSIALDKVLKDLAKFKTVFQSKGRVPKSSVNTDPPKPKKVDYTYPGSRSGMDDWDADGSGSGSGTTSTTSSSMSSTTSSTTSDDWD